MGIKFSKKASLNLSINAIVILVMAMILLGLGIGFIRSTFKNMGSTGTTVTDQVKQQILDNLRTSDKKLSFPSNDITLQKGESKTIAIGVKNQLEQDLTFSIEITQPETGGTGGSSSDLNIKSMYSSDEQTLGVTDVSVIPIKLTAQEISGTALYKIKLKNSDSDEIYASKTFFVNVV